MSLKEWTDQMLSRIKGGRTGNEEEPEYESNMANGGFSGYRPRQEKARNIFATQSIPVQKNTMGNTASHSGMTGMFAPAPGQPGYTGQVSMPGYGFEPNVQQPVDPVQQYTADVGGFQPGMNGTGYQPPMNGAGYQPGMNGTGYQSPMGNTAYQQPPMNGTGYQPEMNGMGYQSPMGSTAYQPGMNGTGYQPPMNGAQPQQPAGFTGRMRAQQPQQPQQPQQSQQPDNISYMPGNFIGPDGRGYRHVERIAQLVSVSACFRIIEFMRNRESVIVNTESIASEADVQRCLDMLAGAAFTLGCSLTKITQVKRAYLIAPETVLVMQDTALSRWSERDNVPQPDESQPEGRYRATKSVYAPDHRMEPEPYQTASYQAAGYQNSAYQELPRQQSSRRRDDYIQNTRPQPRASYDSDTRRGFYGTMRHSQSEQGFGQ